MLDIPHDRRLGNFEFKESRGQTGFGQNFGNVACEVGADIVKLNVPNAEEAAASAPKPYNTLTMSELDGLKKVVKSAGRTLVLVSGGSKLSDDDTVHKARLAMEAGCVGLIFGRNMWQRHWEDAIAMSGKMHSLMKEFGE